MLFLKNLNSLTFRSIIIPNVEMETLNELKRIEIEEKFSFIWGEKKNNFLMTGSTGWNVLAASLFSHSLVTI